jgi:hypothetical protein
MRTPRAPSKKLAAVSHDQPDSAAPGDVSESAELTAALPVIATLAPASAPVKNATAPAVFAVPQATSAAHQSPPTRAAANAGASSASAGFLRVALVFLIGVIVGSSLVVALQTQDSLVERVRACQLIIIFYYYYSMFTLLVRVLPA